MAATKTTVLSRVREDARAQESASAPVEPSKHRPSTRDESLRGLVGELTELAQEIANDGLLDTLNKLRRAIAGDMQRLTHRDRRAEPCPPAASTTPLLGSLRSPSKQVSLRLVRAASSHAGTSVFPPSAPETPENVQVAADAQTAITVGRHGVPWSDRTAFRR